MATEEDLDTEEDTAMVDLATESSESLDNQQWSEFKENHVNRSRTKTS